MQHCEPSSKVVQTGQEWKGPPPRGDAWMRGVASEAAVATRQRVRSSSFFLTVE